MQVLRVVEVRAVGLIMALEACLLGDRLRVHASVGGVSLQWAVTLLALDGLEFPDVLGGQLAEAARLTEAGGVTTDALGVVGLFSLQ